MASSPEYKELIKKIRELSKLEQAASYLGIEVEKGLTRIISLDM